MVINLTYHTKKGNKSKHFAVHRLMAWEFLAHPDNEIYNIVNHLNGIKCCNFIDNLEWTSVLGNTNHAKTIGLLNNSGLNSYNCKYDEKLIRKICSFFEKGYTNYNRIISERVKSEVLFNDYRKLDIRNSRNT
jgi:hypothetical protein